MKDDSYYMNYALAIAPSANCIKGKVGAVIVRNGEILSEGVNSVPNGVTPCTEETCIRKKLDLHAGQNQELCFVVHAEQNALINALNNRKDVQGGTIYVTKKPCIICGKMLINAGIKRIVYLQDYADKYSEGILKEAGIELEKYEGEINN